MFNNIISQGSKLTGSFVFEFHLNLYISCKRTSVLVEFL